MGKLSVQQKRDNKGGGHQQPRGPNVYTTENSATTMTMGEDSKIVHKVTHDSCVNYVPRDANNASSANVFDFMFRSG